MKNIKRTINIAVIITAAAVMLSSSVNAVSPAAEEIPDGAAEEIYASFEQAELEEKHESAQPDTEPVCEEKQTNGTVRYSTLADAETAAGFYFDGPYANPEGLPCAEYSVTDGKVLSIRYYNDQGDERTVNMSRGAQDASAQSDIASADERIKNCDVSIRGTSCGYYSADWKKGSFSFSIRSNIPMTLDEMESAVEQMIL